MKNEISKLSDRYNTPDFIFDQLNRIYNFELDAACTKENSKCSHGLYHEEMDSLKCDWKGRVFCNPPFSQKDKFALKAIQEIERGNASIVVMILPLNCASSPVIHEAISKYSYEILKQRISFVCDETKQEIKGNNTGTIIIYFRNKIVAKRSLYEKSSR